MMAEITPSGNAEQSTESCYSTDEITAKSQVVYVYSKNFQVKTEPVDQDSFEQGINETSHIIADQHMKSCTDHNSNLQQHNQAELTKSRGYVSRPEAERLASKRDHLSEPKRNWTRETITRYEGNSRSFSSNRHNDTTVQSQNENSRHNPEQSTSDDGRNFTIRGSSGVFIESRKDYVKKHSKDRKTTVDREYPVHEKGRKAYQLESNYDAKGVMVHPVPALTPVQREENRIREFQVDRNLKIGRKSFTPNRIYPSDHDSPSKYSTSPRSFSLGMKINGNASPNAPPNVTLIRQDTAKYGLHGEKHRAENNEYGSQWERDECEKKSPNNNPSTDLNNHGGSKRGWFSDDRRSDIARYGEKFLMDTVSGDEKTKEDFPLKRMKKEAYFRRREHDEIDLVTREDLRRKNFYNNEDEWQYSNKQRIIEHPDAGNFRPGFSDRRCSNYRKDDLPVFTEQRYRYQDCYVVRGCLDHGCNNNYRDSTSALHSFDESKEHSERQPRRFSSEEEKRIPPMSYISQGYQRCCCPCCPCHSALRSGTKDRSPISPKCHPRPQPLSPRHYSASESQGNEKSKAKATVQIPAIPTDIQQKLVTRSIPHLRRRRNRTVYTHDQIEELEDVFKIKHYLDVDEKGSIAKRLGIRTENVEIWFKNRRAKWRKEMKSAKPSNGSEVGQLMDSPDLIDSESKDEFGERDSPLTFAKSVNEERKDMHAYQADDFTGSDNSRELPIGN